MQTYLWFRWWEKHNVTAGCAGAVTCCGNNNPRRVVFRNSRAFQDGDRGISVEVHPQLAATCQVLDYATASSVLFLSRNLGSEYVPPGSYMIWTGIRLYAFYDAYCNSLEHLDAPLQGRCHVAGGPGQGTPDSCTPPRIALLSILRDKDCGSAAVRSSHLRPPTSCK